MSEYHWESIGYSQAMRRHTGAMELDTLYPTQDKFSSQDEADYLRGFNQGERDFRSFGYNTVSHYIDEKNIVRR